MLVICTWLITDFCLFHRNKMKHKEKKAATAQTKKPKRLQMHHVSMQRATTSVSGVQEHPTGGSAQEKSLLFVPQFQNSLSPSTENTVSPRHHKLKKKLKSQAKQHLHSPRNLQRKSSEERGSFKLSEDEESDLFPVSNDGKTDEKEENKWIIFCLSVILHPEREDCPHMETSPLSVKSCKIKF